MGSIRARLIAVVASFFLATLASWGVHGITPESRDMVEQWLNHTFDVMLFVGYAVVHPWLQKHWNPTGAFSSVAAQRLEAVAHVEPTRA
jgi:hypothetical protein